MFGWQGVTVSPRAPTTVVLVLAALLVGLVLGRATAAPAPPTVEPIAIDRPAADDRDDSGSVDSGPDDEPAPSTTTTAIPPLTQATTTTAPPAPAAPEPVPTAPAPDVAGTSTRTGPR